MAKLRTLELIALILVVIGALNWALVGIGIALGMQLNIVAMFTDFLVSIGGGMLMWFEPLVYVLIGLAGLYMIYFMTRFYGRLTKLGSGTTA